MENIKRGTFISEYVGEIITNEEAERRGKAYDSDGMTYLFDLVIFFVIHLPPEFLPVSLPTER